MSIEERFPKLIIDESEKDNFNKYVEIKGENLYLQVYIILSEKLGEVSYSNLSSLIRYDKNLRDCLYIYLANFEEYLRVRLFRKIRYDGNDEIKSKNFRRLEFDKKDGSEYFNFNTYNKFNLELGPTIELIEIHNLFEEDVEKFKFVKDLRNKVMHFNMVTLGDAVSLEQASDNMVELKKGIKALKECLPQAYQRGFTGDINKLIINKNIEDFKIKI